MERKKHTNIGLTKKMKEKDERMRGCLKKIME